MSLVLIQRVFHIRRGYRGSIIFSLVLILRICAYLGIKGDQYFSYQEKIGLEYPELIVTRKKGEISNNTSYRCARMRPSLNKWYQVGDLHLYNIITTIIKECRVSFSKKDISNLCLVNKDFGNIVPKVLCCVGGICLSARIRPCFHDGVNWVHPAKLVSWSNTFLLL
jgi:hypothetical protein